MKRIALSIGLLLVIGVAGLLTWRTIDAPKRKGWVHNPQQAASPVVGGETDHDLQKTSTGAGSATPRTEKVPEHAQIQKRIAESGVELALSGTRHDVKLLLQAIESADGEERGQLARSLQALHSPEAAAELQEFMVRNVNNSQVAVQARDALARIATEPDIERICKSIPSDPQEGLARSYLLGVLARVRNPQTVGKLASLCLETKEFALYTSAAIALGGIGTPEAVSSLVDIIHQRAITNPNDPVAQALTSVNNKDSLAVLQEELNKSTNPVIRDSITPVVARLNDQSKRQTDAVTNP